MPCLQRVKELFIAWPILACTTLTTSATLIVFFSFAAAGWPGKSNGCDEAYLTQADCYCERPRGNAWLKQPANTLSNLAFCVVALGIAYCCDSKKWPKREWWENNDNFLTNHNEKRYWVLISFTSIASFLGPGSMFMHASQTHWGGTVDVTSMFLYVGWSALFQVAKISVTLLNSWDRLSRFTAIGAIAYLILMAILIPLYVAGIVNGRILFEVFLYMTIGLEPLLRLYERIYRKKRTARFEIFLVGLVFQGAAFGFWVPSQSGGSFCYSESVFQGHAMWHMLSAMAIGCFFFYHLSEHSIDLECYGNQRKLPEVIPDEEDGCVDNEETAELSR